jgi:hypothetical protein
MERQVHHAIKNGNEMPSTFSAVAGTPIDDHEVHLYYRLAAIPLARGPDVTMNDLVADDGGSNGALDAMPHDQKAALTTKYADTPVWESLTKAKGTNAKWPLSSDLDPAVRELLSGHRPELATHWVLSAQAAPLLQTADLYEDIVSQELRVPKRICLSFNKAAKERLQENAVDPVALIVHLSEASIIAMGTGAAFCTVRVSFERLDGNSLTAAELTEAVAAVSRFNSCKWIAQEDEKAVDSPEFSLGALIRSFAERGTDKRILHRRVSTYTFARTSSHLDADQHEMLGALLARRYTSAYQLDAKNATVTIIREFDNLRHVVSMEGQSTVCTPTSKGHVPNFLTTWKESSFRAAYSPIVLLALHENRFLRINRAKSTEAREAESAVETLNDIIDDALMFRLHFRYASVSDISMQCRFSKALREEHNLDRKLEEMEGDVNAASARVILALQQQESAEEQEKHRRYYWASVLGGASLAGLTAHTMAKEVLTLALPADQELADWTAIGLGFAIIVGSAIVMIRRGPTKPSHEHTGHLTMDAMVKNMIKRALR